MLLITDRDIITLSVFIDKSVKNPDDKNLLTEAISTGKPVIAKALLLLLVGADFGFIQTYTRMPQGYFKRFLDRFYDLHGKFPRLVFVFPNLRENAEVMRQIYFTAGLRKDFDFLKEVERVLGVYDKLSRVAGKLVVPPTAPEKEKSSESSEKPKPPTEYLDKMEKLARLDKTAEDFLSKYSLSDKIKFLKSLQKDPSSIAYGVFNAKPSKGEVEQEEVSEDIEKEEK